ncbi:hypothetical protein [Gracilibacillus suaedae]|nr:hypothetical protein [Gracilibacillus suaedae]
MSNSNENISKWIRETTNDKHQFIRAISELIHDTLAENKKGEKEHEKYD